MNGTTTFFFQVDYQKHLFTVPVTASAKVPVTQVGDSVTIEYYDSGESVMPVNKFDNVSFELEMSVNQAEVEARALDHIDGARTKRENSRDVQSALDKLSPAERDLVKKNLKQ